MRSLLRVYASACAFAACSRALDPSPPTARCTLSTLLLLARAPLSANSWFLCNRASVFIMKVFECPYLSPTMLFCAWFLLSLISGSRPRLSYRFYLPEYPSSSPSSYSLGIAVSSAAHAQQSWTPPACTGELGPVLLLRWLRLRLLFYVVTAVLTLLFLYSLDLLYWQSKHIFCFSGDLCTCYRAENEGDQRVPFYLGLPNFKIGVLCPETRSVPGERARWSPCLNTCSPHLIFRFVLFAVRPSPVCQPLSYSFSPLVTSPLFSQTMCTLFFLLCPHHQVNF